MDIINIFGVPVLGGVRCPKCRVLLGKKAKYCSNCGLRIHRL